MPRTTPPKNSTMRNGGIFWGSRLPPQKQMEKGKLAQQQGFDLELQILKSQRGYYIGTATSEGYPVSRESAEYFPDSSTAQQALTDNRWTQREDC